MKSTQQIQRTRPLGKTSFQQIEQKYLTTLESREIEASAKSGPSFEGQDKILRNTRKLSLGSSRNTQTFGSFTDRGPGNFFYVSFYRRSMRVTIGTHSPVIVTSNEVTFHLPGQSCIREALASEGGEYEWIAIHPDLLQFIGVSNLYKHEVPAYAPLWPSHFITQRQLFTAFVNPPRAVESQYLEAALLTFVRNLISDTVTHWRQRQEGSRSLRPTCVKRRMQIAEDAKLLLAREFLTDLSFRKIADAVHCSQCHLVRAFHDATGLLPGDYRRELRLRKGLFLMEETRSDIGDIAIHVGFSSHSHFTSAFHRSFGSTPTEFVRWRAQPIFVSPDIAA